MTETQVDQPVRIFLFTVASIVVFSIMNMLAKIAAQDATIAQITFFRSALAFIPISLLIYRQGGLRLLKTNDHLGHFWRGSVGVMSMVCFFTSFAMLPMANATAIHFASPLLLTLLSIPMLGERVGIVRWLAVITGLAGVLFMLQPGGEGNLTGSTIAFAAAFLAAFAMIHVRKLGRTEHALTIVFYFTLYGTILGGLGMVFMWAPLQPDTLFYLVLVGLLGGVGQTFLTYAYAHAPASFVAPFSYLSMILAVVWDIVIWQIWPEWQIYAGSLVIIGSGLFIVYREARKKKEVAVRTSLYALQPVRPTDADN